jgi:hypothetical protein
MHRSTSNLHFVSQQQFHNQSVPTNLICERMWHAKFKKKCLCELNAEEPIRRALLYLMTKCQFSLHIRIPIRIEPDALCQWIQIWIRKADEPHKKEINKGMLCLKGLDVLSGSPLKKSKKRNRKLFYIFTCKLFKLIFNQDKNWVWIRNRIRSGICILWNLPNTDSMAAAESATTIPCL